MGKLKILAVLLVSVLIGVGIAVAVKQYVIPSTGYYKGELFIDPSSIDWGNLTRGASSIRSINLTNAGPDITSLNMTHTLKSGNLYNYTLTWNVEGNSLPTGTWTTATLNLTIYDADEGPFSIDITVNTT